MAFVVHFTLTDIIVANCDESFIEDIVTDDIYPSLGLFRDRTTYEGQASGNFHNHILKDDAGALIVAEDCQAAVDDSVADIGNVVSDIYGNEIALQKRIAGIG